MLRFEQIATEIPGDFPITAASTLIDYDWVTISENKYLLPTHSEMLLTHGEPQDDAFRVATKFASVVTKSLARS